MLVYGFIGSSGTGKSHRALWVAKERNISCIIDDGLLIHGSSVLAGVSAKKEATRIASIKRALFTDPRHADEVRTALENNNIDAVLILGTSKDMVEAIAKTLGLPQVEGFVFINEVATDVEIKKALSMRKEQGKHVIPVPTFEIKKDFSGYFLDPLKIFRRRGKGDFQLVGEKSVVRPTFSYMGKYTISDHTIFQICEHVALGFPEIKKLLRFRTENHVDGLCIQMELTVVYGSSIKEMLARLQKSIASEIDMLTALNIKSVDVVARQIVMNKKEE